MRTRKVGENPSIGIQSQVGVGEVVYTKFDYWEFDLATLNGEFQQKGLLANWDVPTGDRLVFLADKKSVPKLKPIKYCSIARSFARGRPVSRPSSVFPRSRPETWKWMNLLRLTCQDFWALQPG